jgi:nucleoside-diphosphate-sugar epimerase
MYGTPGCSGREDEPVYPATPYGRHKLAMEAVLAASGVDYLALRVTNCVGAYHSPHQMLPGLVTQLRSGAIDVYRGAHRDLIAADDLVTVIDELLVKGVNRTVVNVASGYAVASEQIIAHLEKRLGTSAVWRSVDAPANYRISTERLFELVPKAAEFGFGPDYYRAVLDRYLDYYADATRAA